MDTSSSMFLFFFLLSINLIIVCSSSQYHQTFTSTYRRELVVQSTIKDDFLNPPITTYPTIPAITNPVTTPAATAPPEIPTTATPATFPVTDPVLNPPILPITNPVTTIPGSAQPAITNPATTPVVVPPVITDPATTPVVGQPAASAPAVPGQSWCVAKSGLPESALQAALDYACGIADCTAIQEGASCYNPNSMQNHASYAFNSYYQRNPVQTSCDFGGTAMVTNVNPGSGSCIFTTSSSSSASPTMPSPITMPSSGTTIPTPTPTTESSSGASPIGLGFGPPAALNGGSPPQGGGITGFGESPFAGNSSSISTSSSLKPFIGCIIVVTSMITRRIISDI